jgi:hypothetical protein
MVNVQTGDFEGLTLEVGTERALRMDGMGASHYNYRVVRCPTAITYSDACTQGFDFITSTLAVALDTAPRMY